MSGQLTFTYTHKIALTFLVGVDYVLKNNGTIEASAGQETHRIHAPRSEAVNEVGSLRCGDRLRGPPGALT